MRFLVDTNVLVYAVADDASGEFCRKLLAGVASGELEGICSVAVMEEVWHLELSRRIAGMEGQTERSRRLFAPLLPVTDETFSRAMALKTDMLGANDRIHWATCAQHAIPAILSADRGFDGAGSLRRIDPLDEVAIEALSRPD